MGVAFRGDDRTGIVQRTSDRIHDAAEQPFPNWDVEHAMGSARLRAGCQARAFIQQNDARLRRGRG